MSYREDFIMNFFEFMKKFPDEDSVIKYFIKIRYKQETPKCNHCECDEAKKIIPEKSRPKFFHCNNCNSSFSLFKGTIFEKSSTDLRKWMYAIHLFLNGRQGISGYQFQREIGVTYKTAWRMLKQIRTDMGNSDNLEFVETVVELDETYVDGKPRKGNRHKDDDDNDTGSISKRGCGTNKTPVVEVVDRESKRVYAKVAVPNKDGKKLTGKQLLDILHDELKATTLSSQTNSELIIFSNQQNMLI